MNITQEIIAAGGSVQDQGQAWIISYWYVPGGYDYASAQACNAFIDDKAAADRIVARYEYPAEMAFLISREQFNQVRDQIQESSSIY